MIWYTDNDIVVKLGSIDFVEEGLQALGITKSDVRIVQTAQYKLHTLSAREKGEQKFGKDAHARIAAFVNTVAKVDVLSGQAYHDGIGTLPNVDAGELILIGETAANADSVLLTGDKRSLRAIAGDRRGIAVTQAIAGRVVCFEQAVLAVIEKYGFDKTASKMIAGAACDGALTQAYAISAVGAATEEEVVKRLQDCVTKLRAETGSLLRP